MTHIVLVHGIRSKPASEVLRESCRFFLSQSSRIELSLDQVRLAYWADLAGYQPRADDRGSLQAYSFRDRVTFGGLGIAKGAAIEAVERHLSALLNRAQAPDAGEVVQRLAESLKFLEGRLAAEVMRSFIHDVYAYFLGGIRESVKDRLREQLDRLPTGSRVGLVGHSLGSVVALDVLLSDRRKVSWLLTLGSPLGFNAVRAKMGFRPEEWDSLPRSVPRWDNLYDPIDIVSLDSELATDLPAAAPNDQGIRNEFVTSEGERNHHSLYGFLAHRETGALTAGFLED
jgi:hypothetical protein